MNCWTRIYPAFANSVDPDQLASKKPIDLYLHCLPFSMWIYVNNLDQVIWKKRCGILIYSAGQGDEIQINMIKYQHFQTDSCSNSYLICCTIKEGNKVVCFRLFFVFNFCVVWFNLFTQSGFFYLISLGWSISKRKSV